MSAVDLILKYTEVRADVLVAEADAMLRTLAEIRALPEVAEKAPARP